MGDTVSNLVKRRKELHLTQVALAAKAGCSQRHISSIENCHAEPSLNLARTLARVLETSVDELFAPVASRSA